MSRVYAAFLVAVMALTIFLEYGHLLGYAMLTLVVADEVSSYARKAWP